MIKQLIKHRWMEAILISSHNLNHVTEVCDRIAILDHGEIVKDIVTSESTLSDLESYFAV